MNQYRNKYKRKVLVFHRIIAPYRIDFFNRLSEHFNIKVCLYQSNLNGQKFDYKKIESKLQFVPQYILKKSLGIQRGIFSNICSFSPDTILVSECDLSAVIAIIWRFITRAKYRIVSIVDDSYDMLVGNNQFSKLHALAEKFVLPRIDSIITVEPRVAAYFQKKYEKGIYFPIIADEIKSRKNYERILPLSEQIVNLYGLEGKKVLLFVGRLVEIKNVQMVIPAFKQLEDPNLRFVLVGSGDYEMRLKELAKGDDRIIFVGRKEDDELYAWYNVAQCFVLASYQEAFGAVTNEALLGGCWSLISEKAGSQCLIENGINGNTFCPNDSQKFLSLLEDAFLKQAPLRLPLALRPNLMKVTFEERILAVIDTFT